MNDITFVTCIYSNLKDGSPSRRDRYYTSLSNMLLMEVPFIVYCAPEEEKDIRSHIKNNELVTLIPYDLTRTSRHNDWNVLRQKFEHNNRCMELVHNKIKWMVDSKNIIDSKRYYWIDAGLSFFSLFPKRFIRNEKHIGFEKYTDISVFNRDLVDKIINKHSDDLIYNVAMRATVMLWSNPLPEILYNNNFEFRKKFHVIAGIFGGTYKNIEWLHGEYEKKLDEVVEYYKSGKADRRDLPVEELILNILVVNNIEKFYLDYFDTWYHEDHEACFDMHKKGTSFYKLFI